MIRALGLRADDDADFAFTARVYLKRIAELERQRLAVNIDFERGHSRRHRGVA